MKLWYDHAAKQWTDALPLGNGHMGAMNYGDGNGRFDLSEATCWSGAPQQKNLEENASEFMRAAREKLVNGDIEAGEELLCHCNGIKENYGTQLPLARLWVGTGRQLNFIRRSLDLSVGVCRDEMTIEGVDIFRESFISNPDKVMAVRLRAQGGCLPDVVIRLEGLCHLESVGCEDGILVVRGSAFESMHSDGRHGVSYICRLALQTDECTNFDKDTFTVQNASIITVMICTMTDMFFEDADGVAKKRILDATEKGWDALLADHIQEHSGLMARCSFELEDGEAAELPTDKRLESYRCGKADHGLNALIFQYGRYLLLNSSRRDSLLPAALQGVWNDNRACKMGWTDDMHLDINTQLNYFPAESTGLGECCMPLFHWITGVLVPRGQHIARELYGCSGWVAHTVSNAYGWAAPGWGGVDWAFHVTGGAWISTHFWQHYLYTEDREFLREVYPFLQGAAEFIYNLLLPDPKTGELLVSPSYSPENAFLLNGKSHTISAGATIDTLIAKCLFEAVCKAHDILCIDDPLPERLRAAAEKLPAFHVGKYGQLMEWHEDYEEAHPDHRHTSHILSLYPFGLIDPDDTPELAQAVKTTLRRRLEAEGPDIIHANWSATLLMLYYARLQDGDEAARFADHLINDLCRENLMLTHHDGIYELDGNTGFTAGIAEMLMHSHREEIHILPAIPSCWKCGKFSGLVAQHNHKVSVTWEDHVPVDVKVTAGTKGKIRLRFGESVTTLDYVNHQTHSFLFSNGQFLLNENQ
jgi:alpha-L-fucosidase 2